MAYQGTAILGLARAQLTQLEAAVRRINPSAPPVAELYLRYAPLLGVRGDLAYAQALHETGHFRYGGLVKPEQNNFAGIGATGPGNPGATFRSPDEGVLAHLQHLFAYASTHPLPEGMKKVDPRFDRVQRGSATYIGDLNGKWAVPGTNYGQSIDRILADILMEPDESEPYQVTKAYLDTDSQNRPGPCSGSRCWEGVRGIVVHRTASPTMDARAIRNYFNDAPDGRFASSQFVLDNEEILQLMPVGEIAHHTRGKNFTHLGIETCEHNWGTEAWEETYRKLVWLTAYLVRKFALSISDVTGHYVWDPVDRPYDPTYPGWSPGDGKAKGLFEWNQFISDVKEQAAIAPPVTKGVSTEVPSGAAGAESPMVIPVTVVGPDAAPVECTRGIVYNNMTYVPIREYTACLYPDAEVTWHQETQSVTVKLPLKSEAEPAPDPA